MIVYLTSKFAALGFIFSIPQTVTNTEVLYL